MKNASLSGNRSVQFLFGFLVTLILPGTSLAAGPNLTLIVGGVKKTHSLSELKSKLKSVTVSVNDTVYHQQKTYDGFLLNDFLALSGPIPADSDEIVFTAIDGYTPSIAMKKAKDHHPVLTYAEHGKSHYEKVVQGKATLDPGPFYVVWSDESGVGEEYPWPYQIASIELVSFEKKFPKLYPKNAPASSQVMNGFMTYKNLCMRCHSINLEGGELAPELNVPKNITEYWDAKTLHEFIKNASSFRLKSKMPPFLNVLTDEQISEVIEYLKWMKGLKIQF